MKTLKPLILLLLVVAFTKRASSQEFVNLNFESADVSAYPPPNAVPVGDAIPGWAAYIGSTELAAISYDELTLGDANVGIDDATFINGSFVIQGQYSIMLQPGLNPFSNTGFQQASASISQTGVVPIGSKSLLFDAEIGTPFTVSVGGSSLTLAVLGSSVNDAGEKFTEYGANIANYAGETEALTVTALAAQNSSDIFDAFSFSPMVVPEPPTWGLAALGVAFLASGIWKRRPI